MTYELTIEPLGEVIEVREGQSLLDACLRRGIYLPHACTHGRCSTCKVTVLEGDVEVGDASDFALMDFERQQGVRLACVATCRSDATIEADVEADEDAERHPVVDVVGVVVGHEALTANIVQLTVDVPEFVFQAGQYVNVAIPGLARPRAFSVASPPSQRNRLELQVKRVAGGPGTAWLHEGVRVGDTLTLSGPYGRFYVRRSAERPMIFVGGGSGISAVMSMVVDLLEQGTDQPVTLFYGARDVPDLHHDALFRRLAADHAGFTYVPALSHCPEERGWRGCTGYVHDTLAEHFGGKFAGHHAYLCGPPPMIDACVTTLMRGRLFERDIFTEKFITEADGGSSLSKSPLFKKL